LILSSSLSCPCWPLAIILLRLKALLNLLRYPLKLKSSILKSFESTSTTFIVSTLRLSSSLTRSTQVARKSNILLLHCSCSLPTVWIIVRDVGFVFIVDRWNRNRWNRNRWTWQATGNRFGYRSAPNGLIQSPLATWSSVPATVSTRLVYPLPATLRRLNRILFSCLSSMPATTTTHSINLTFPGLQIWQLDRLLLCLRLRRLDRPLPYMQLNRNSIKQVCTPVASSTRLDVPHITTHTHHYTTLTLPLLPYFTPLLISTVIFLWLLPFSSIGHESGGVLEFWPCSKWYFFFSFPILLFYSFSS